MNVTLAKAMNEGAISWINSAVVHATEKKVSDVR